MILLLILITGAVAWAFSEILVLIDGGPALLSGTFLGLALSLVAIGIWGLKDMVGLSRSGRSGIVLVCFGLVSFAMVQIIILTAGTLGALQRGEISFGDIVLTPFYLLALVFLVLGLGSFTAHFKKVAVPAFAAPIFALLAVSHAVRIFFPDSMPLHSLSDIGTALVLTALAIGALRERAA